jgi:hypothetical protein
VIHQLFAIDAAQYRSHPLHSAERCWTETNCYVDVWIEVLHALGLDPAAAGAFSLSTDFEGEQWTFFKIPPEDLRALYGLEVGEMNVWRPIIDHVAEQLDLGRLLTVEVDSWFLPDTQGVSYRLAHVKSTIVPQYLNLAERRLGYFHNAGYHELAGDDFDGLFGRGEYRPALLPPYVELVRLDRMWHDEDRLLHVAEELTRTHLARRPVDNPIRRLGKRLHADVEWLQSEGMARFHEYAFGTCRQCGASADVAAAFVQWLGERTGEPLEPIVEQFTTVAHGAKAVQFALARAVAGRHSDLDSPLEEMAEAWEGAMASLADRCGH